MTHHEHKLSLRRSGDELPGERSRRDLNKIPLSIQTYIYYSAFGVGGQ